MFYDLMTSRRMQRVQTGREGSSDRANRFGRNSTDSTEVSKGELARDKRHLFGTSGQQGDVSKQTRNTRVL